MEEAEGIVRRIKQAVQSGKRSYRDFAILLRINALTRGLETAFVQERVPFQIVKGLAFFDRKENRDVLAYLRLLVNPRDNVSFERVVNEPPRGIGKVSLDHLKTYAETNEVSLLSACGRAEFIPAIKGKAASALREFGAMMLKLTETLEAPPDEVIRQVLDRTGYRKMLKESRDEEDQDRLANIEELITAAKQFATEDSQHTITDFLENITLASDVDGWDQKQDCVSVMTMHAAKGLEFPVVYLVAVEQGLLPHERSLNKPVEVEEERRLAFVGMTRLEGGVVPDPRPDARVPRPDAVRGAEHVPQRAPRGRGGNDRSVEHGGPAELPGLPHRRQSGGAAGMGGRGRGDPVAGPAEAAHG